MGRKGLRVIEKSEGIIGRVVSLALANAMAALSLCLRRSVFRVWSTASWRVIVK